MVVAPVQKTVAVSQTIIPSLVAAAVVADKPVPVSSSSSIAEKPQQEVAAITIPVVEPVAAIKGN